MTSHCPNCQMLLHQLIIYRRQANLTLHYSITDVFTQRDTIVSAVTGHSKLSQTKLSLVLALSEHTGQHSLHWDA